MIYKFGYLVFLIYLKIFFRRKVYGRSNLPGRKAFIVCSNHICWRDPTAVGTALPIDYKIHFMAKNDLFKNALFSYLLKKAGAFPVNRNEADFGAIKKAYQLLKEGKIVGMFPEGTRSTDGLMHKAYGGAALIAVRSGVPVLPVAIAGPYRLFKPLRIYIGPPFVLPPLVYNNKFEKKKQLEELSAEIMDHIKRLVPEDAQFYH